MLCEVIRHYNRGHTKILIPVIQHFVKRPISGMLRCWHIIQFNHLQKTYTLVTNKNISLQSQISPDSWTQAILEHETDSHLSSVHNLLFHFASNLIEQLWHNWMKHDTKPFLQYQILYVYFLATSQYFQSWTRPWKKWKPHGSFKQCQKTMWNV